MTRREIIERITQGVLRIHPDASQERLRMQMDAAFFGISNEVAEAFAQLESRRASLRANVSLTFSAGQATIPSTVLKKYLDDATLTVNGVILDFREPYTDFLKFWDVRLGVWAVNDSTAYARTPVNAVLTDYAGPATLTCIAAPAIDPVPDNPYAGPDDMLPQLIDAGIAFMLGETQRMAAENA